MNASVSMSDVCPPIYYRPQFSTISPKFGNNKNEILLKFVNQLPHEHAQQNLS